MRDAGLVMGVDVGTGGVRAVIVRADDGAVMGTGTSAVSLHTPRSGWSQQDPDDWWPAATAAIGQALAAASIEGDAVAALGLTGQMHGCTLVDERLEAIRPALLWNDQRTVEQCHALATLLPEQRWRSLAGKPPLCGLTLPSVMWVRQHEPDAWRRVRWIMLPKDFLRLKLTGEIATDVGDAAGTMLLDIARRAWSHDITTAVDLDQALLPPVLEGPVVTGAVSPAAAEATGLLAGTPVVAGGGDQQTGALACGVTAPGMVSLNMGTSGVLFAATDSAHDAPPRGLHAFCHSVPDVWHVMGVMLSAGGSLRWWRDINGASYDALVEAASSRSPGADGVRFLPYLSGERTPHENPDATGAFVGLRLAHDQAHLTRAVMEGVCLGLRDGLERIRTVTSVESVRVTGGATASPIWRRLLADVLGVSLIEVSTTDGSAFGAAVLATVGADLHDDVGTACAAMVRETDTTTPGPDATRYDEIHPDWQRLYAVTAGNDSASA